MLVGSWCILFRFEADQSGFIGMWSYLEKEEWRNGRSEELTSPNAEEKRDIKEGIPSDDDLWV